MSEKSNFRSVTSWDGCDVAMRALEIGEDKVRTTHGPLHWARTQEPPHRYPISLQLRYKATSKHGLLYGLGQTRMMSSKDIIFGGGNGLKPGMKAEIAVAWPVLLDGHIRLQLVLEATIISSQDDVTEARILAYHFRTRGPAESQ